MNLMFGFAQTQNLNLHSGSGSTVWLNRTSNIRFGSGSNIVCNVRNRTAASLPWTGLALIYEGQGQGRQNQVRAGPDRPVDSLLVSFNMGLIVA